MAQAKMNFLNQNETNLIHTQSVRALWEIGIKEEKQVCRNPY